MPINIFQMFRNRHLYPEFLYLRKLISKEKLVEFRLKRIEKESKNTSVGVFCNTEYVENLYDKIIGTQTKIRKVKQYSDLEGVKKLFCLEYVGNGKDIDELFLHCIDKNVVIQDQFSWYDNSNLPYFQYRGINYDLRNKTEIPSHFGTDQYIYELKKIIQKFRRPINVMDMCAGSGCIGFSLLNETNLISNIFSVEINPGFIDSMNSTISYNKLPIDKIKILNSDVFDNVASGIKVELVTCNPPHSNRTVRKMSDLAGADEHWNFHRKFFSSIGNYIADDGIVTIMERKFSSNLNTFKHMIPDSLLVKEVMDIPLTDWYVIILVKK